MKRWPKVALAVGALTLVGALLWALIAVPLLVRLPGSIDKTTTYQGTLTSTVDLASGQQLATPVNVPMTVTRHVRTVRGQTTRTNEVLAETITTKVGPQSTTEEHRYTIDRKHMRLRGGSNSWSYAPTNLVDRRGSYRLTFPIGTKRNAQYTVWSNELGTTVRANSDPTTTKIRGLKTVSVHGAGTGAVSPAYGQAIRARGIPTTISIAQIKGSLAILGFNPDQLVSDVTAAAGSAAGAAVQAGLNQRLPVQFSFVVRNTLSNVEPQTGEIVRTHVDQAIAASIDAHALATLKESLAPLATIPSVKQTMDILDVVAGAAAQPVISWTFDSTPASVQAAVQDARTHLRQLRIVRNGVPAGLVGLGVAFGLLGLFGLVRGRAARRDATADVVSADVRESAVTGEIDLRATPAPESTNAATEASGAKTVT